MLENSKSFLKFTSFLQDSFYKIYFFKFPSYDVVYILEITIYEKKIFQGLMVKYSLISHIFIFFFQKLNNAFFETHNYQKHVNQNHRRKQEKSLRNQSPGIVINDQRSSVMHKT